MFNRNGLVVDQSLTAMVLVADQCLPAMARWSDFNSNCKPRIVDLVGTGSPYRSFIAGLAHESAVNRGTKSLIAL